MTRSHFTFKALTTVIFVLAFCAMAQAQATRTWVSGVGDDVNPCSRTAPCKTFAGAISKTFIAGEIDVLDPGGFGTLSITKSITLDGGGFSGGGVLASGVTNGILINIAANGNDPQRRVQIRRLAINGTGASGAIGTSTGANGIRVSTNGAAQVTIENVYISNFTTTGIDVNPTSNQTRVAITDTYINNTVTGVQWNTGAGGFVSGVLERVRIQHCTNGVIAKDNAFMAVAHSVIQHCTTSGASIISPSNAARISLEGTVLYSVGTGVVAGGAGTIIDMSNSSIIDSANGVATSGGTVNSHGNNTIVNTPAGTAMNPLGQQ